MINWRNSKYVEGGCSQIGCKSLMLYLNYFSKLKVTTEYSSVSVSVKMIVSSIMKLSIKLSASHRLTQLSQSLDTSSCKLDSELIHNKILFHYVSGWTGAGRAETSFQRVWQGFNIFLSSKLGKSKGSWRFSLTIFY